MVEQEQRIQPLFVANRQLLFLLWMNIWAQSLEKLGLAPKPLPARKANTKQLASRIKTVLSNAAYLRNAEKVGSKIRLQQGVNNAVALIERTFQSKCNAIKYKLT